MEIAVLSDIHGNYEALRSCVEYALERNIKTFVFLGDYVGELAKPQRVLQYLYELREKYQCQFIRGNKEQYFIDYESNGATGWEPNHSTTGFLYYAYENLTKRDLQFFQDMKTVDVLSFGGLEDVTICHGSPRKINENLYPGESNTFEVMEQSKTRLILYGHIHRQRKLTHKGISLLNPGAVGLSLEAAGKAQFMILHGKEGLWKEEFVSLHYDSEKEISLLFEEHLDQMAPYWCKLTVHALREGQSDASPANVLFRAMEICKERDGECIWPAIPEECWKAAYEEFFGKEELQSFDASRDVKKYAFPECLSKEMIYESFWMSMYRDKVRMSDGSLIEQYHRVHVPNDSVCVVVMNEEDEILLIRSKRYTTGRMEWEIPAGGINPGECQEEAAKRECLEETGCEIEKIKYLCSMNPCNGVTDVLIHYYMARVSTKKMKGASGSVMDADISCELCASGKTGCQETVAFDENEVLEKRFVSKKEVLKMIQNNSTRSEISAFAILYALQFGECCVVKCPMYIHEKMYIGHSFVPPSKILGNPPAVSINVSLSCKNK